MSTDKSPTRHFLVPAFFVVSAANAEEADKIAESIQTYALSKGIALYLDEVLPTVEASDPGEQEFHSVMDEHGIQEAACNHMLS